MHTRKICAVLISISLVMTGCQSGKFSMPSLPKLSLWKDGRPKLFAKKEKELGPPSKYFGEEADQVAQDNPKPLDIEKGKVETPDLPSKAMEPYPNVGGAPLQPKKSGDNFNTPAVAGFDKSQTPPSIREPYQYKPDSKESLAEAAKSLSNNWKDMGDKNASPQTNDFDNSFSPPPRSLDPIAKNTPTAPTTNNEFDAGSSVGKADDSNSTLLSPKEPNRSLPSVAMDDPLPKTTYSKTAQSSNSFEATMPRNISSQSLPDAAPQKIENQFFNDPIVSKPKSNSEFVTQPSTDFPRTKSQAYVVQNNDPASEANDQFQSLAPMSTAPQTGSRTVTLPEQLRVSTGYAPGSVGRKF